MFESILSNTSTLTVVAVLSCTLVSLVLGFIIAITYMADKKNSKSMAVSLIILPALIEVVIMMVNGNIGAGVAVAGAFSLVRFRSVPGTSKEICYIFFAMAVGLATGMGFLAFAFIITVILCLVMFILTKVGFGETKELKELKVTIPENLDYTEIFDDIFKKYTKENELYKVKTTNLGSMYELSYEIVLNDKNEEKKFIDEIRCRNGNLPIICGRAQKGREEL